MESAAQTTNERSASPSAGATAPAVIAPVAAEATPAKRKRRPFAILGVVALVAVAVIGT
jgi:hypothetical protein